MTTYTCQKCGTAATVENGVVVRGCACAAPVIANIKAHATGQGGVK